MASGNLSSIFVPEENNDSTLHQLWAPPAMQKSKEWSEKPTHPADSTKIKIKKKKKIVQ